MWSVIAEQKAELTEPAPFQVSLWEVIPVYPY